MNKSGVLNYMLCFRILTIVFVVSFASVAFAQEQTTESYIKEVLTEGKKVQGEEIRALPVLVKFYEANEYKPIWIKSGGPTPLAHDLVKVLNSSSKEGLSPKLYRTQKIEDLLKGHSNFADIELLLTDAFFSLGFHYSYGAIDPGTGKLRWIEPEASEKLKAALQTAISANGAEGPLNALLPHGAVYIGLKKALVQYEEMAAKVKWPKIDGLSKGQKINVGDDDERIPLIRDRFNVAKKVHDNEQHNPNIYDSDLEQAVIEFQRENGLLDDGVIGYRTVDVMNVPIENRVCQIKVNLDRLRALSNIWDQPNRIVVNIPAFWLETYENGSLALDMKVIDGMRKRKTPTLSSEIVHLIFSPKWYVPDVILFEYKLPHIRKDPGYLRRHGMRVFEKGGGEVDPESIDWTQFQSKHIPYRVVQGSGDANALGRVKFIFPNRYDVYLHDTPQKELFKNAQRTFSSGCVRIEKPVELASLLLKDKPEWDADKIKDAMNRSSERVVPLTNPMPVHIIYVTAWADKNGMLQFRDDVYDYDGRYKKLLCD